MDTSDTIAAIATPSAPALRGMVRISGPEAWNVAMEGFEPVAEKPTRAEVRLGFLTIDGLRRRLPASITFWPGSKTYTGEPLAEIETVGALPILQQLLADRLARGARVAEPGEFTLRAFLSGRIDLTQAEAVLGVIDADDPARLDSALKQLAGGMASPISGLRERLLDLLAHLEAGLDFVDEADVDPIARRMLAEELGNAAETVQTLANQFSDRDRPEGRPRVVLVGPPNAGKSRLYNALIGSNRAIVSSIAGTTRDYLSAPCDCGGIAVELLDTAGIEPPTGPISSSAQALRDEIMAVADLILDCASVDAPRRVIASDRPRLLVWNKADLMASDSPEALETSAIEGFGIAELLSAIGHAIRSRPVGGDGVSATGARCREGLVRAGEALREASATTLRGDGDEFVALDLRRAIEELGRVVGEDVGDEVLDRIFRKFCVGK